jgi:hypothetical protein
MKNKWHNEIIIIIIIIIIIPKTKSIFADIYGTEIANMKLCTNKFNLKNALEIFVFRPQVLI